MGALRDAARAAQLLAVALVAGCLSGPAQAPASSVQDTAGLHFDQPHLHVGDWYEMTTWTDTVNATRNRTVVARTTFLADTLLPCGSETVAARRYDYDERQTRADGSSVHTKVNRTSTVYVDRTRSCAIWNGTTDAPNRHEVFQGLSQCTAVPWPDSLTVGATQQYRCVTSEHHDNRQQAWSNRTLEASETITAVQDITVPAGTFHAWNAVANQTGAAAATTWWADVGCFGAHQVLEQTTHSRSQLTAYHCA